MFFYFYFIFYLGVLIYKVFFFFFGWGIKQRLNSPKLALDSHWSILATSIIHNKFKFHFFFFLITQTLKVRFWINFPLVRIGLSTFKGLLGPNWGLYIKAWCGELLSSCKHEYL